MMIHLRLRRLGLPACRLGYAALVRAAALALLAGCTSATVESSPVASVSLTPSTASVRAGNTITLAAKALDSAGATVDVRAFTWSSSDRSVATVSTSGVVTALAPGDARIAASAVGKSATATITVTAREVASVVIAPSSVSMRIGVTTPLQATTLDADGATLTGRVVSWSSGNPSVATVSAQGVVTGVSAGAATITATSEGRSGQVAVTVTLPPVQTVTVTPALDTLAVGTERAHSAVLRDAGGAVLTGRALSWSSNNVAVATVSSGGVVSALSPGNATISATSEGRVGTASIVVLARLAGAVTLLPASSTLIVGATQTLATQITDSQGNLLTDRPVSYVSDAPGVATVNASGVVSAIAPGTAHITASSEGKSGVATVQVIPIPVASVQVTPNTAAILVGGALQLVVVPRSASGAELVGRTVSYTSGAPAVASVSSAGLVTGLAPGTAVILALVDGVSATSTITVTQPAIASVTVTPVDPTIDVLGSIQLAATLRDAGNSVLTGRTITWSSANESIAFVSSTGLVVGFRSGTVRITATSEGVSASTLITVR